METGDDGPLHFPCPRCGIGAEERYYGPCASCRAALVAAQAGAARQVDAGRFEPSMHVVPNQVATKE
jgi:hypothetical protein